MSWPERHRRLARGEESGRDHVWSCLLRPWSWLYRGYAAGRNAAYDAGLLPIREADVPVVSVGSLSAGGTGKTPLLALLGNHLHAAGRRPLLVVRGYRAPAGSRRARLVSRGAGGHGDHRGAGVGTGGHGDRRSAGVGAGGYGDRRGAGPGADRDTGGGTYLDAGDEAVLLSRLAPHCAVAVARRREEALEAARAGGAAADILLLDGAFQHRRLARSLDIVSLDVSRPPSAARLLPWGDFREPWSSLRRAHEIVLYRAEACADRDAWQQWIARWAPQAGVAWCSSELGTPYALGARASLAGGQGDSGDATGAATGGDGSRAVTGSGPRALSWERLRGRRVGVYAGIGAPETFLAAVRAHGVDPVWTRLVADHAPFGSAQARSLAAEVARAKLDHVLVTEKDAVRMEAQSGELDAVAVVPAKLCFGGESENWPRRIEAYLPPPRRG